MKEPLWIEERDALALHHRLLGLHGGAVGLRDASVLISALARPRQHHAYAESPNIIDMATAYTRATHPFIVTNALQGTLLKGRRAGFRTPNPHFDLCGFASCRETVRNVA